MGTHVCLADIQWWQAARHEPRLWCPECRWKSVLLFDCFGSELGIEHPEIDLAVKRAHQFFDSFVDKGGIPYGMHGAAATDDSNGKNTGVAFALKQIGDPEPNILLRCPPMLRLPVGRGMAMIISGIGLLGQQRCVGPKERCNPPEYAVAVLRFVGL